MNRQHLKRSQDDTMLHRFSWLVQNLFLSIFHRGFRRAAWLSRRAFIVKLSIIPVVTNAITCPRDHPNLPPPSIASFRSKTIFV